ncbi:MAG TPA: hypothetical protein PLD99_00645 [Parcubacteria group bacterium]|nr:hypothetical protein [Parcubacteria group bacterium]
MSRVIHIIKNNIVLVLILLLVVMTGASIYLYNKSARLSADPNVKAEEEVARLVERVGKLIYLPEDETPTMATVSDPELLKDQPFFAKARVGDKVLLYQKSKKAYLYDPKSNKLLEVAPINIGTEEK